MKIRRAAAVALMGEITRRLTIPMGQPPTIVNAPPSRKAEYPAIALLIDSADFVIYNDDEDVQFDDTKSLGDDGFELTGFYRTDPNTDEYRTGPTYMLDSATTASQIGTIRMKGRLWVGSRLDAQREQIEQEIVLIFYADRAAPGRLQVSVAGVEVGGFKIPFGVATAIFEDKLQWNSEFAFAERLWTYAPVSLDVPLMIPRTDPLASELTLLVTQDLTTTVTQPSHLDNLVDLREFDVNSNGDVTEI